MPEIRVFEPVSCCSTGGCGPEVDQALVDTTGEPGQLQGMGAESEGSGVPAGRADLGLTEKSHGCCGSDGCC